MRKVEVDIDLLYKMVDYSLSYINTRIDEIEDLITHSTEEGEADYFLSAHKEFIDNYQAISQVISEEES